MITRNKHENSTNHSFENSTPKMMTAAVGIGVVAAGIAVGGVFGYDKLTETPKQDLYSAPAEEQAQFKYVTDLPHALQDNLLVIQAAHDAKKHPLKLPTDIPAVTLNQTDQYLLTIKDAAGGLAEQATHEYKAKHGLLDDQQAPLSVQDSITVTTKALSQINHLEHRSDTIQPNETYDLIELKDAEGNNLVVVSTSNDYILN